MSQSISIDGVEYDAVTGLPVEDSSSAHHAAAEKHPVARHHSHASGVHSGPQRSVTLRRRSTKHPAKKIINHPHVAHAHAQAKPVTHTTTVTRHPEVRRFAPHPVGVQQPAKRVMDFGPKKMDISPKKADVGPVPHPMVTRAHAVSAAKEQTLTARLPTAQETKTEALKSAVANTHKQAPLKKGIQPKQRIAAIISATLALVIFGAYLTYLNMPALSVRVAAAQAGIDASYPNYHPDGYGLAGPVTYTDGKVAMNFQANGGPQNFTLSETKSAWNNDAVLDNYVTPRAGSSYIPYTERGLTIYTFDNNAAWVNGGILYTIDGNAPLSSEQIRRIATSLL